jgi:hypothetical protein
MAGDVFRKNALAMAVGVVVALAGVGLWALDQVAIGWLLVVLGGIGTGFLANEDGFRVAAMAALPLLGLAGLGGLGYLLLDGTFRSGAGVAVVAIFGVFLLQFLVILATPFIVAGGVGGWLRAKARG